MLPERHFASPASISVKMTSDPAGRRPPWKLSWQRKFLLYVLTMQVSVLLILRTRIPSFRSTTPESESESGLSPVNQYLHHNIEGLLSVSVTEEEKVEGWLPENDIVRRLEVVNQRPPRNLELFPDVITNSTESVILVLYVHNRPAYLQLVVDALSRVEGLNETLLIVSHDGCYEEMNAIIEAIKFCRVKQIFAPLSPHLHPNTFPGFSKGDCEGQVSDNRLQRCCGEPDQNGFYRKPQLVSLKHHWWWMMHTVWDGLPETREFQGHIAFIEEDHFLYPNAYRTLQLLVKVKSQKCPMCWAAMLAPYDVNSPGEFGWDRLVLETMGNIGYTFNRTVWEEIKAHTHEFCTFDDYNWDVTLRAVVFPHVANHAMALRSSARSAMHFGRCGLHEGQSIQDCVSNAGATIPHMKPVDFHVTFNETWPIHKKSARKYRQDPKFKGWGGWGDTRDHRLCLHFAGKTVEEGRSIQMANTSLHKEDKMDDANK